MGREDCRVTTEALKKKAGLGLIVDRSKAVDEVRRQIDMLAAYKISVLIYGAGELKVSGTFSGSGRSAVVLQFSNGFELAEGLPVAGAVQGFLGSDQRVYRQHVQLQARDLNA